MIKDLAKLKTGTRPVHRKTVHLFKVHYKACGQDDVWRATDGEGYQEYVRAETRYEAARKLGILDLLKQKA
jgi:hypothetical protein